MNENTKILRGDRIGFLVVFLSEKKEAVHARTASFGFTLRGANTMLQSS